MLPIWALVMIMGILVGVFLHALLGVIIVIVGLLMLVTDRPHRT